jgi:hypothetical protein
MALLTREGDLLVNLEQHVAGLAVLTDLAIHEGPMRRDGEPQGARANAGFPTF